MKSLLQLQPSTMGIGLFGLAAAILCATIITGQAGLVTLSLALANIAQPTCAAAIAVLMYLAIIARRAEQAEIQ